MIGGCSRTGWLVVVVYWMVIGCSRAGWLVVTSMDGWLVVVVELGGWWL